MLRLVALVLLVVNLALAAWNLGWLGQPGQGEREPQRLAQQATPQAVTLLAPQAASQALAQAAAAARAASGSSGGANLGAASPVAPASAAAASAAPTEASGASSISAAAAAARCYESGPLAPTEVAAAEKALREATPALPRWSSIKLERGGLFMIYMGKYSDAALLARKRDELRRINVAFEDVRNAPALQPGLSLGRFEDRTEANAALGRIAQRGVKSARVVLLTAPVVVTQLRFEPVNDEALRERLLALHLPPGGARFAACVNPRP